MCHRGAGINVSLCCRPYLTIPTKIRQPLRTDRGWQRNGGRWGRKSKWQHRCIIHLFVIRRFSPLIIPRSPQKPVSSVFFCLGKCHLSERDWEEAARRNIFLAWILILCNLCQHCGSGFPSEYTQIILKKIETSKAGSYKLTHRYFYFLKEKLQRWAERIRVKFQRSSQAVMQNDFTITRVNWLPMSNVKTCTDTCSQSILCSLKYDHDRG